MALLSRSAYFSSIRLELSITPWKPTLSLALARAESLAFVGLPTLDGLLESSGEGSSFDPDPPMPSDFSRLLAVMSPLRTPRPGDLLFSAQFSVD